MMMMRSNQELKKSRSLFLSKQSPANSSSSIAMGVPRSSSSSNLVIPVQIAQQPNTAKSKNKSSSPLIEYPASPQLILGEEILHFSHPQHPLSQADVPDLFTCAGCKEYGSGPRYTCQVCDYQLHHFCALAPPALKAHPLHIQHQLLFSSKPAAGKGGGILKSKCDVCGKASKGFSFRCSACGYQMHPCCAMLSTEINISVHPHPLKLLPSSPAISLGNGGATSPTTLNMISSNNINGSSSSSSSYVCAECKRKKRSGRVYRCTVCDYHLHAVCAKNMVNGLQANGIKGPVKGSMLGTAARLASLAVVEFIGGLIEGLGESVGEVLVQSIARGHRSTSTNVTAAAATTTNNKHY